MNSGASHVASGQEAELLGKSEWWVSGYDMVGAITVTITSNKARFTEYSPGLDASAR